MIASFTGVECNYMAAYKAPICLTAHFTVVLESKSFSAVNLGFNKLSQIEITKKSSRFIQKAV